jgi:hypothetical protein
LIGCLACQRACPANRQLPVADSGVVFSAEETRSLLDATAGNEVSSSIRMKAEQLGQQYHAAVFGRNLRALVDARRTFDDEPAH